MSRQPGHLKKVFEISRWVAKSPIKLKISTVITKLNVKDAVAIAEMVKSVGATEWKIDQFRPNRGDAILNREIFELDPKEFENTARMCEEACKGTNIEVKHVSLNDRYGDFFTMTPNGSIEVSTGDRSYPLGNILISKKDNILSNYRKIVT
jgi:MoaA/NifB/PqqE/SkfB family radical SAM enzyme